MVEETLDSISLNHIENLNSTGGKSVSVIKNLKSIENGIGVILFIYSLIFLAAEIVFLIFSFGDKEFTPLPETTFKVLNGIKITCLSFSITMIFLSILYGILLAIALFQYINIVPYYDKCELGIIVGMVYGYYCFWFYITLSSLFSKERALFVLVGSADNPGPGAQFDASGKPIAHAAIVQPIQTVQPVQPTTYANLETANNGVIPINQVQNNYQPLALNSKDDEFIVYNGAIYKKVGNAKNVESNNIQNAANNGNPNEVQTIEIKTKQNK